MTQLPRPIQEFSQYMLVVRGRLPRTVEQYEIDLMLFFKFMKAKRAGLPQSGETFDTMTIHELNDDFVSSVTRMDVMEFLAYLATERDNHARARARKLSTLKSFYRYHCGVMMRMKDNPTAHIETPKIPKTLPKHLSAEESVTLLRAVNSDDESRFKERNYCIITLFLNCGMRLSELVGLNLGDLDRDLRSLRVMGKGAKERVIYLNDACRSALETYLKVRERNPAGGHRNALFLSARRTRISKQMVQTVVYRYLSAAGLDNRGLSVHKLRHTAATLLYQTGQVDIRVLKDILGHEQLNTTQIYTHVSNAEMERAMTKNPLASLTAKKIGREEES